MIEKLKSLGKSKDFWLLPVLIIIVVIFTFQMIFTNDERAESNAVYLSENEKKISKILSEMVGVGEAEVMICEDENGVVGVVVVCEGANDILVQISVREAVASALGSPPSAVKIYLKK